MKKTSVLSRGLFRLVRSGVRLVYGKTKIIAKEKPPEQQAIFVANHSQIHGPLVGELFMPQNCYLWCAGEVMNKKEFSDYAMKVFWPAPSPKMKGVCQGASKLLAPLAACLFTNARTVEVRRDYRIKNTFRESIGLLEQGRNLLIFPENDTPNNAILNDFHEHFVDLARHYYKKTGVRLRFVPVYNAPDLKCTVIGKATVFDPDAPLEQERKRIVEYLSREITLRAKELPPHKVVPFKPTPKDQMPLNR